MITFHESLTILLINFIWKCYPRNIHISIVWKFIYMWFQIIAANRSGTVSLVLRSRTFCPDNENDNQIRVGITDVGRFSRSNHSIFASLLYIAHIWKHISWKSDVKWHFGFHVEQMNKTYALVNGCKIYSCPGPVKFNKSHRGFFNESAEGR